MSMGQELLQASIALQLFGLGLSGVWSEVASLPLGPARLGRMLAARNLLVPAVVMSTLSAVGASRAAIIGATILAISPGALFVPQGLIGKRSGSETVLGTSVVATLGSIVTLPLSLPIVCWLLVSDASVAPAAVAQLAGVLFLLPLGLGAAVRRFEPPLMKIASGPVIVTADLLLWLALVPLVGHTLETLPRLGFPFILVVTCAPCMAVLAAVFSRSVNAEPFEVGALCRTPHPGLALLITASNFAGEAVLPAVVVSFVGLLAASMLYTFLTRHARGALSGSTAAVVAGASDEASIPHTSPPR